MCILSSFLKVSEACLCDLGTSRFQRREVLQGLVLTSDFVKFCSNMFLYVEFQT
jgi:hypothetical protein